MSGNNNAVELRGISKNFGGVEVLRKVNLSVCEGETLALLGPSGCGKSTTLNIIAGFFPPDEGVVLLSGEDVTDVPSHKRNIGMVFQSYSLFPHMTIYDNVAFGLTVRNRPKSEVKERVEWALDLVRLLDTADRFPAQLSGGQQQRIAVARALGVTPQVLLMDEPLSNLDAKLRKEMQIELKRIQADTGITMVYVTHDQEEAIVLADRIALLGQGEIDQLADPQTLFEFPSTLYGAQFMGYTNILTGHVSKQRGQDLIVELDQGSQLVVRADTRREVGSPVNVCIREERVIVDRVLEDEPDLDTLDDWIDETNSILNGRIEETIYAGSFYAVFVVCKGGLHLRVRVPIRQFGVSPLRPGAIVQVKLSKQDLRIVGREG